MIRFTILGQPVSHKNGYRIVTLGKRPAIIKSKEAIAYEGAALQQIPVAARVRLGCPVRVTLHLHYASERPDMDESLILDVLQDHFGKDPSGKRFLMRAGVYQNDRQVREKFVHHHIDRKNPRAEVAVEPLTQELFEPC